MDRRSAVAVSTRKPTDTNVCFSLPYVLKLTDLFRPNYDFSCGPLARLRNAGRGRSTS
jgi:hypothetical protein